MYKRQALELRKTYTEYLVTPLHRYRKQQRNKQKAKHVKKTCFYNRYLVQETTKTKAISETQTNEMTKEQHTATV